MATTGARRSPIIVQLFSCDNCQQTLFFENVVCTRCSRQLAYLPDRRILSTLQGPRDPSPGLTWTAGATSDGRTYRFCRNDADHAVCNWAVPSDDADPFCWSCRLNQTIPNLSNPSAHSAWQRMEIAKRRMLHTLYALGLPVDGKRHDPRGLAFAFLQDGCDVVFTGHSEGLVTINLAEADDPFREKMRVRMGEPYRTLLGHFRHEIGHYYWDRLVNGGPLSSDFRSLFGDERADYAQSQNRHYQQGAPGDWSYRFVSAYASMHPWEDWAETWAHYLHMSDTLETARAYGLALAPRPLHGPAAPVVAVRGLDPAAFDDLLTGWVALTMALNSLNRSMGLPDSYPFVLSTPAIDKLRFVHHVIAVSAGHSPGG